MSHRDASEVRGTGEGRAAAWPGPEQHAAEGIAPAAHAVKVAYLVLSHEWPAGHHRLVDRLTGGGSSVVVHVDKAVDPRPFARLDVTTVREPVHVNWGGWSLAEAMIRALETGLSRHVDATHFQFLSGRDYPARPEAEFLDLLAADPTRSFVAFEDMTAPGAQFPNIPREWAPMDLYARLPFDADRLVGRLTRRLPPRAVPDGLTPFRGSAWSCLTREAASYVVDALRSPSNRRLTAYFRTIRIPDEIVFQTILGNSPLAPTIDSWPTSPGTNARLHHIDWSPTRENPAVLDVGDLQAIEASGRYFIRKVGPQKSGALVRELDARRAAPAADAQGVAETVEPSRPTVRRRPAAPRRHAPKA